jgi:uncharacterized protein (DUF2252 family)
MDDIVASVKAYEAWLDERLAGGTRRDDLDRKHVKMAGSAFDFLRATYWRWCEHAPDLPDTPVVLSVGDIHVENFGTWRDVEGRLVFGVNDFDEAAPMPWPHDLLRLLASAVMGAQEKAPWAPRQSFAALLLAGYRDGIAFPRPLILDGTGGLSDSLVATTEEDHRSFWEEEDNEAKKRAEKPPARFRTVLERAFPPDAVIDVFYAREAGLGSLGRPRFAALARFHGGRALREAKALVPSAWTLRDGGSAPANHTAAAAAGAHRSPDAWFAVQKGIARRRLSPNNRKIEFPKKISGHTTPRPLHPDMLYAMGHDLAAIHAGTEGAAEAIASALAGRGGDPAWLEDAAMGLVQLIVQDHAAYVAANPALAEQAAEKAKKKK